MQEPDYKSHTLSLYSSDTKKHFHIDASNEVLISSVEQNEQGQNIYKPINVRSALWVYEPFSTQFLNVAFNLSTNTMKITNEENRAKLAEQNLQTDIDNETKRAGDAEIYLQQQIDTEVTRSTQVDANFSNQLAVEISDRLKGDNTLTTNLDFEIARATAAEVVLTNDLAAEVKRATDAEYALSQDFLSYQQSNASQHEQLSADLSAHVLTYESRVMAVEESVSALEAKHNTEMKTETDARVADVANLQQQIANILSNTDPTAIDSLSEIVSTFQDNGASYTQRLDAIEAILNNLVSQ